jgi:hypothetical protein
LEVEDIVVKIAKQANIENNPGYKISIEDKVRFIETKYILKKTRYKITSFYSFISDLCGKSISFAVSDGSMKTITR